MIKLIGFAKFVRGTRERELLLHENGFKIVPFLHSFFFFLSTPEKGYESVKYLDENFVNGFRKSSIKTFHEMICRNLSVSNNSKGFFLSFSNTFTTCNRTA